LPQEIRMKMMGRVLGALCVAALSSPAMAATLAQWDFEASAISASNTATFGPIAASTGSGNASGAHASAGTDWSTVTGAKSVRSFNSNNWAIGDYYQFQTSSTGFQDVQLSFYQTGSDTGPKDFKLQYSTDGSLFNDFGAPYAVSNSGTAWSTSMSQAAADFYKFTFDLSAVAAVENAPAIYFRLTNTSTNSLDGGTVGTAGSSHVDLFTITADAIPGAVPLPVASIGGMALLGILAGRRPARHI
jgi:hypothetical protein